MTLASGIGATTAVFSLVYGVLLRPLPYPGADRLVRVWEEHPGGTPAVAASRCLRQHRESVSVARRGASMMPLVNVSAVTTFSLPPEAGAGKPTLTRTLTYIVTPGYAQALGLRLRAGRFFDERDASAGTHAMIVNDEFVRRYLSDAAVGRRFRRCTRTRPSSPNRRRVGTVLKDGNDRQPEPEVISSTDRRRGA